MEEQKNKKPQSSSAGASASAKQRRISAKRKQQIVTRLLQGESIEILSRENNVTAAAISEWRDKFLQDGGGLATDFAGPSTTWCRRVKTQIRRDSSRFCRAAAYLNWLLLLVKNKDGLQWLSFWAGAFERNSHCLPVF